MSKTYFLFQNLGAVGGRGLLVRNKTLWNGKNFSVMERKIIWKRKLKDCAENEKGPRNN